MLKTKVVEEIVYNGRVYTLESPSEAPIGEFYDVICMMRHNVAEKIKELSVNENKIPEEKQ